MKSGLRFQRIMVFGRPGSGKSTFAYSLHCKTGIPVYHLDKYYYLESWIERDYSEFLEIQRALVDTEQWIVDGNNRRSLGIRWEKADLVVYFNYPRWRCYWRVIKRLFSKNPSIEDRAKDCQEKPSRALWRSIWTFERRFADNVHRLKKQYPQVPFYEISSDSELQKIYEMIPTSIEV